jgi:hypothetical protein
MDALKQVPDLVRVPVVSLTEKLDAVASQAACAYALMTLAREHED